MVALATGGLLAGCDSDEKIAKSSAGESCTKTSDCDDNLKCLDGTCYKTSASSGGSANSEGGEGNTTAGTTVVGPKPPVLGKLGESCARRADCVDGLACLNQRCSEDVMVGAGGEGSGGPTLGGPGETCGLTSDCGEGLSCLPGYGEGSYGVGICTPIDSGLKPTGKVCGAECVEAADCCELPVAQHALLGAYSCADLAALVEDIPTCATAVGLEGSRCLAYSAYCDDQCGKNTWSCDTGSCVYKAKCTKATQVVGGCPAYTRGGHGVSPCDVKTSKCEPVAAVVAGCTSDAKCDAGLAVADSVGDTCSKGECSCNTATGGCYRKCSEPADCPVSYTCDDKTSMCSPVGNCSSDAQCINAYHDVRYTCVAGACKPPACEHDIDCSPFGLNGSFTKVCGPDKQCVPLGCSSDDECPAYVGVGNSGGVRSFCADPVVGTVPGGPVSAITD